MTSRYNLRSKKPATSTPPPEKFDRESYSKLLDELFPSQYRRNMKADKEPVEEESDHDSDYTTESDTEDDSDEEESEEDDESEDEKGMNFVLQFGKKKEKESKTWLQYQKSVAGKSKSERQFFLKLDQTKQNELVRRVEALDSSDATPPRISLLESDLPPHVKALALQKMAAMKSESSEAHKWRIWVNGFMSIPFNKYCTLPVQLSDGVDACHAFMLGAKTILDGCTYGMADAKMQLLQFVGQVIANPNACGSAVGIHGPMGTGKTTLVTKGLSKILQRPFVMIALGGASDGSVLEGNLVTYEGSVWGRIVNSLMQCKCMNPIFYFDELDKVSETPKGEEIIGILTHLTDLSQNDKFQDKYFSELEFDLSKALFVFSYNDETKVNPILRDRMYTICTEGYSTAEKLVIAKEHLIKNIRTNVNFEEGQVVFQDDALLAIIGQFCSKEKGVRTLKRCIETVFTKLNLLRLMKPGENIFQAELPLKAEFPFTVTVETVRALLKSPQMDECALMMYG